MTRTAGERADFQHRWEYVSIWRYGPILLVVLGLGMVVYGMAVERPNSVVIAVMTLGLVSAIAGVVLPRVEGQFSATSKGVSGSLVRITELDVASSGFAVAGPAVVDESIPARAVGEAVITIGDAWEELVKMGFRVVEGMAGSRALEDSRGRSVVLPVVDAAGSRAASHELLSSLRAWDVEPTASGRYLSTEWLEYERGNRPRPLWAVDS